MSHSRTSRRRTTRRRRCASRIGSPPVRRLPRSVRRRSMCSPRRSRSARRVRRVGVASSQPRHQPVERGELARLERVEALAAQPLLVARRHRDGDARAVAASPLAGRVAAVAAPRGRRGARRRTGSAPAARRAAAGVRRRSSSGAGSGSIDPRRRTPRRTRRRTPAPAPGRRRAPRAPSSTAACARPAASASAPAAKRAERSGVTGTPASCSRRPKRGDQRRQVELDGLDLHAIDELSEAGGADDVLVLAVLEHRAERAVDRRRVERRPRRAARARASQSIASAIPGGFCTSPVAHPRDRGHDLDGERLRRALARAGARSRPRARASGSRSTGTGSGA